MRCFLLILSMSFIELQFLFWSLVVKGTTSLDSSQDTPDLSLLHEVKNWEDEANLIILTYFIHSVDLLLVKSTFFEEI